MKIVYMITDACNSMCKHCYREKSQSITRSISQCRKNVKAMMDKGHQVIIAGAEVLLNREYLELHQLAGQDYLISNGILLAQYPDLYGELVDYGIRNIGISWHIGFQSILNNIPEDIIKRAVENSLEKRLNVCIHCVISNKNYKLLDEISQRVIEIGAKRLKFIQLISTRPELARYQLTRSQKKKVFDQIVRLRRMYRKEILYIKLHANFSAQINEKSKRAVENGIFCPAGNDFIVIETNDRIYPCPFLAKLQFCIGYYCNGKLVIDKKIRNAGKFCLSECLLNQQFSSEEV